MKSAIKIDLDNHDTPFISIQCVHTSNDLRDKSLQSFLRKLGFEYAKHDQEATLRIVYRGWGGGTDSYENFDVYPEINSAHFQEPQEEK